MTGDFFFEKTIKYFFTITSKMRYFLGHCLLQIFVQILDFKKIENYREKSEPYK